MSNSFVRALDRRSFVAAAPLTLCGPSLALAQEAQSPSPVGSPLPASFPAHSIEMAREMVGSSHNNLERVKQLVQARPALARAAYDWGFGDWEDALGAASHVGNRPIAEFLLANGARPTLFSATMLGHLDTVKAFLAAQPGLQRTPGPHSISLLAHAKAGGKQSEAVYQYLESLGDAGSPQRPVLPPDDAKSLLGSYVFGPGPSDQVDIVEKNGMLSFVPKGQTGRNLFYVGDMAFHPAGASTVRIRFNGSGSNLTLTVHDPDLMLTARRKP